MSPRMNLTESLAVLREARASSVVVTSMGTAREWMAFGPLHPRDFIYVPSSMGQATALGLGLAIGRPKLRVIVCNGDGSMLMNLGSLVTIAAQAPENLVVLVFENGVYEVTGAQPIPGSANGIIDFLDIARGCGFVNVHSYDHIDPWRSDVHEILRAKGPTFVLMKVDPVPGARGPRSPGPTPERARQFAEALQRE